MKKLQLTAILLFPLIVFSQNWQPVNENYSYNYQLGNLDYITNTIRTDSFEVIGSDTVFYLNRIVTNCDTCQNNQNNDFILRNQPQFLMRQVTKQSDSMFVFSDTVGFTIKPLAHWGETWQFDSQTNALISFEGEEVVCGVLDSVKYISLSNNKLIKISKNYGIIDFYSDNETKYYLVGIEGGITIGESLPNFWTFYNWDVGDVFQRETHGCSNGGNGTDCTYTTKKYIIDSKEIIQDTIKYLVSGYMHYLHTTDIGYPVEDWYDSFEETIIHIDSSDHFTNKYPYELVDMSIYDEWLIYESPLLNKVEIYKENGLHVKKAGRYWDEWFPHYSEESPNSDLLVRNIYGGPDAIEIKYLEGCGLDYNVWYFEVEYGDTFMGKVHNGDTIGYVYPDSYFVNVKEVANNKDLIIYPNPISKGQSLHIKTDAKIESYNIYNISGKKVISNNYFGEIEVDRLTSGLYILELVADNKVYREKIIIK